MNQIKENRKKFRVDHFDIVVSEYVGRYMDGKVILDPPYQRKFRWDIETQSALIESILIGIPLPPIFAFSNDEYNWEIIDGLQRTSTLIKFINSVDNSPNELRFEGCEILTDLNGKTLSELPPNVLNNLKNARLRIELVEDNDDLYSQYLLFSRLNSNGEDLSPQELRNFLIYKLSPYFYEQMRSFRDDSSFELSLSLKKQRIEKQEDIEYILRYFICQNIMKGESSEKNYSKIDILITKETQLYLEGINKEKIDLEFMNISKTYRYINSLLGENAFRYFHKNLNSVTNTSVIAPAIGMMIDDFEKLDSEESKIIISDFFDSNIYSELTKRSYSPTRRYFKLSIAAFDYFKKILKERV